MNTTKRAWRGGIALGLLLGALLAGREAPGQSYGPGVSPGRAAYRPPSSWNNGPFYTAPHVDPWAPRAVGGSALPYYEAQAPPYTNQPRGRFSDYGSTTAPLYPYQQGFSPFSGYAPWYLRSSGVVPDQRNVAAATAAYFRSSPIPPDRRYLAPSVVAALEAPPASATGPARVTPPAARRAPQADPTRPRVYVVRPRRIQAGPPATPVFRPGIPRSR